MPFCPKCGYEYIENVTTCPDCQVPLVPILNNDHPNDHSDENVPFKALPDLPGRVYADMVIGVLEERGIPCYVRSDGVMDAFGIAGTGPVSRGFRIFVPENRYQECIEIQHQMMDHI